MKQLFILTTLLLAGHILIAQTPTRADVTTPKGSNVVAYIPNEMSSSNRAYWDSHYSSAYPNATQITTYGSYMAWVLRGMKIMALTLLGGPHFLHGTRLDNETISIKFALYLIHLYHIGT